MKKEKYNPLLGIRVVTSRRGKLAILLECEVTIERQSKRRMCFWITARVRMKRRTKIVSLPWFSKQSAHEIIAPFIFPEPQPAAK